MAALDFVPDKTGKEFIQSRAFIKIIMGPVGSGKSTVAVWDLFFRACSQEPFNGVRRTKMILMRNTVQQLKATVKPLIDQWFVTMADGALGRWRLTENVFEFDFAMPDGTRVFSEFCLMAADTPDDVRRLLSLEASAAWCEEAREIDPEVFSGLQGRVNRFPNRVTGGVTYPGVICSTNPPPLGGFWHDMISDPDEKCGVFIQPPALLDDGSLNPEAENLANLHPEYYENLVAGKTDDWVDVYLKNRFGAGDLGQPIYKSTFKPSFHVAKSPLSAVIQTINPLIVGMDNGLQSAVTIGQQDSRGRVNVLGECYVPEDVTMGVETFMRTMVVPKLRNEFPQFKTENVVFVLDPACWQRSQATEVTVAQVVAKHGFRVLKASTNDPEKRIGAVEQLLARQIDGQAAFLVDPRCTHLINTLTWGHRYKKTSSGLTSSQVEKNHMANQGDSLQYMCLHYNTQSEGAWFARSKARKVVNRRYLYV